MKQKEVKEKIIEVAIRLIKESNGDLSLVSTRAIAKEAGIANGLMNYHFKNKDELITIAIQRMIGEVVSLYHPTFDSSLSLEERIVEGAANVFEFLFQNELISRISILDDFSKKEGWNNTMSSQGLIKDSLKEDLDQDERNLFAFVLVSSMQVALLSYGNSTSLSGHLLSKKEERKDFIRSTVHMLLNGCHTKKQ
ncbi:MAG: TetR/AcrR family transcriptional regulator [Bacilli bacterium]|nr:TetR/AcrR family transcriptional regulator [Bacilli bacterium]